MLKLDKHQDCTLWRIGTPYLLSSSGLIFGYWILLANPGGRHTCPEWQTSRKNLASLRIDKCTMCVQCVFTQCLASVLNLLFRAKWPDNVMLEQSLCPTKCRGGLGVRFGFLEACVKQWTLLQICALYRIEVRWSEQFLQLTNKQQDQLFHTNYRVCEKGAFSGV